jgi:hypothetical protein
MRGVKVADLPERNTEQIRSFDNDHDKFGTRGGT